MLSIDLNCDMGESYGRFRIGNDAAIFPFITSCNVACGFHGGDAQTIDDTIRGALSHGIQIGAHPSYPDLSGFGRRSMRIPISELTAIVKYQVAAVKSITEGLGGRMRYVKPHGALYNDAADNVQVSEAIINALKELDPELILMGLAGSITGETATAEGIQFVAEGFADRRYLSNGKLMSRLLEGAVIDDPETAAAQVVSMVTDQTVKSNSGDPVALEVQSVCVHGDNARALEILKAIDAALADHQIVKQAFA